MTELTQKRLKELLHYDPDSGVFTWKVNRGGIAKAEVVAGCIGSHKYILINVDRKRYLAHRLAFLYMENHFPVNQVEHINRIKSDNCWGNLRHSTNG